MRLREIFNDPILLEAVCLWDEHRRTPNNHSESLSQHENSEAFQEAIRELNALDWLESPDLSDDEEEELSISYLQNSFSIQPGPLPIEGYTLLSIIGKGSFGEVWKAVGPGGFPLALKIISMQDGLDLVEVRALELLGK